MMTITRPKESQKLKLPILRKQVYDYIDKHPNANLQELQFEFKYRSKQVLKNYKCDYWKEKSRVDVNREELLNHLRVVIDFINTKVPVMRLSKEVEGAIEYINKMVESGK